MRILHGILAGAVALTTTAVLPPTQAMADPPSPPYNAFVLDAPPGGGLATGIHAPNPTDLVVQVTRDSQYVTSSAYRNGYPAQTWRLTLRPPVGGTLEAGNTYPLGPSDSTHVRGYFSGSQGTCHLLSGSVTVHELTWGEANTAVSAAWSISGRCVDATSSVHFEVRSNSARSLPITMPSATKVAFGSQWLGRWSPKRTMTFTAAGAEPSVFGAVSVVSGGEIFAVTDDTCSNTTLYYGGSCSIGITTKPVALGVETGQLKIPLNTGSGAMYPQLSVFGADPRQLLVSASSIEFDTTVVGETSQAETVTLTATGADPVTISPATIDGADPASFRVNRDTCSGVVLAVGQECEIAVVARPTGKGPKSAALRIPNDSLSSPVTVPLSVNGQGANKGTYYPLTPSRILDTREGNGAARAPAAPGGTLHLQVTGRGGVPVAGVSAVVLNVTVVEPTGWGYVTVFPTGQAKPNASALNFTPGWSGANSVTVAVGSDGKVDLFNSGGFTHLLADVVGYYAQDNGLVPGYGTGGELQPVRPERLFDSRDDWGMKLPAGHWVNIPVSYGDTYDPHIRALAVNVTAVDAAWPGYLTTFDGNSPIPNTSTLNVTPGAVVPNFAVVPAGRCYDCGPNPVPMIGIYASTYVHVIVDIVGFYDDGQLADGVHDGLRFTPQSPRRIVDSRHGQGMPGALGSGATASLAPPVDALPPATDALAVNITAVAPTANTFIAMWPTDLPRPNISALNPSRGQIVPNAAVALLGQDNRFNVYNNAGTVDIIVDLVGTFYYLPATLTGSGSSLDLKKADARSQARTEGLTATRLSPQLRHS